VVSPTRGIFPWSGKDMRGKRVIIGISGASGVIYGIELLKELSKRDIEIHLVISDSGKKNIAIETEYSVADVESMADKVYDNADLSAPLASGSFLTKGMVVAPCTIKTLSGIANSYSNNLIVRAADVTLKEKRKLVLLVRETPLHKGHLQLMATAADLGAHILPPMPSFYNHPKTIEDIIHQTIGKVFDYLGIEHNLYQRWGENK
jgi:4-hydroxy-3-polyprenylbenzoate decarboxylase